MMGNLGGIVKDLLLIDLIGQLIGGLIRLAVIVIVVIVIVALLGGHCFGPVCIPDIVDLRNLFGGVLRVTGQETQGEAECPQFQSAFPQLLPDTWTLQHVQAINIDGDSEKECLAIYQYNAGNGPYGGPLGGVVYDPQPDRDPQNLATPVPYRPAAYIPYHLLPREDGKGFLSERGAQKSDWSDMIQIYDADGDTLNELVIQGYSGYGFPTYLSIFKWQNKEDGYRLLTRPLAGETVGGPLWGDAGIEIKRATRTDEQGNEVETGPIEKVTVKIRPSQPFWYFRSQLCHAQIYGWDQAQPVLEYQNDYYLTFCFGRPNDVLTRQDQYFLWYPEEALLAWYEKGEVKEISIPPYPAGRTLDATVTLRQGSQQRWMATWKLLESSDGQVGKMTYWYLQQIGTPYDP